MAVKEEVSNLMAARLCGHGSRVVFHIMWV
jgi:hypothetical protein